MQGGEYIVALIIAIELVRYVSYGVPRVLHRQDVDAFQFPAFPALQKRAFACGLYAKTRHIPA
jgi:hypothetical protein